MITHYTTKAPLAWNVRYKLKQMMPGRKVSSKHNHALACKVLPVVDDVLAGKHHKVR